MICLAILLGFSKDEISQLSQLPEHREKRMKAFLLMQKYLSSDIIFWTFNPSDRPFTSKELPWAPPSFLSRTWGPIHEMLRDPYYDTENYEVTNDVAFADESGFHVRYPGIALDLRELTEKSEKTISIFLDQSNATDSIAKVYRCFVLFVLG